MQVILSEEEFEIYKRCKKVIEKNYKTTQTSNVKSNEYAVDILKWALGITDKYPNPKDYMNYELDDDVFN